MTTTVLITAINRYGFAVGSTQPIADDQALAMIGRGEARLSDAIWPPASTTPAVAAASKPAASALDVQVVAAAGGVGAVSGYGILPTYLGPVADRARTCYNLSGANKQWGGRTACTAMDDITPATGMRIVDIGAYTGASGEVNSALDTLAYAVEYPSGTIAPVTYGGAATGTCAAGARVASDPVSVTIPRGAVFWLRYYKASTAGMLYVGGQNIPFSVTDISSSGDYFEFGASGITDKTRGGAYSNTSAPDGFCSPPAAIVGYTNRRTVGIAGDSRTTGIMDHWGNQWRHRGPIERSVCRFFGTISGSQSSESANTYNGSAGALRRALLNDYCSDIITYYGTNDLGSGATATRLAALWALFPGKRVWACTIEPITTSSDAWATLANQTVAANEAERQAVNTAIRLRPAALAGVCDIADVTEWARSGKWDVKYTVDPSQYVAFDGLHSTSLLAQAVAQARAVDPQLLGWRA